MAHSFSPDEINPLAEQFEHSSPQEILAWAAAEFAPDIALSSSFQTQSLPLLHMAMQAMPDIRIFFLNTGYHFWDYADLPRATGAGDEYERDRPVPRSALGCFPAAVWT